MSDNEKTDPRMRAEPRLLGALPRLLMPVAIILAVSIAAAAWYRVKVKRDTISVTGSATRRITSDLIEWDSTIRHTAETRADAYRKVRGDVDKTVAYLRAQGITEDEVRISSTEIAAVYDTEYQQVGDQAVPQERLRGYLATQRITVTSPNVERVEQISREVTALLDQDVPIESAPPQYHYTGLGDLKIEMLAQASADARERATGILESAGDARLGNIVDTQMGVININPANSTATSWEGNNDKTALEKDIITVVRVTYEID